MRSAAVRVARGGISCGRESSPPGVCAFRPILARTRWERAAPRHSPASTCASNPCGRRENAEIRTSPRLSPPRKIALCAGRQLINALPARFWRWRAPSGSVVGIAAFHRIADGPDDGLSFPPSRFRELCAYWRAEYEVLPLDALFGPLPAARAFRLILTFDDGYADNAEIAAPILEQFGLPATFFLATDFLDAPSGRGFPWDRSHRPLPRIMTWRQVETLSRAGFGIGSHTCTHVRLSQCTPPIARREVERSRQQLQAHLGRPVQDFAYPFGGRADCTDGDRRRVQAAGYRCCLGCYGGLSRVGEDPYRLPRIAVNPRDYLTPSAWERQFRRWLAQARQDGEGLPAPAIAAAA